MNYLRPFLTPLFITLSSAFVVGGTAGYLVGRMTVSPTLSTLEAVIDRSGMRWSREDAERYCVTSDHMHPPFQASLVGTEVLAPESGAGDLGTLVCYWDIDHAGSTFWRK